MRPKAPFLIISSGLLATSVLAQAQVNLLADPSLEASEPASQENPSWTLEANQPDGQNFSAQYQSAGWASYPAGTAGIGLWLKAFEGGNSETEPAAEVTLTQRVPGEAGQGYELRAAVRVETNYSSASTILALDFLNGAGEILASVENELNGKHPADGSWEFFSAKGTAPEGTTELQARATMVGGVNAMANPQSAMVDDFSLTAVELASVAQVVDSGGGTTRFRIVVENTEGSTVDPDSARLTFGGEDVPLENSQQGTLTAFTYLSETPFEADARIPWVFQAVDQNGEVIAAEGRHRVPGSILYAGGTVDVLHVYGTGVEITDAALARASFEDQEAEGRGTFTVPFVHFDDGGAPPIYESASRPYPLFDPDLDGEVSLQGSDHYAILATGEFYLKEGGIVPFVVNSDDGFELKVDGELVGTFGNRSRMNSVLTTELEAGLHTFELLHWEAAGGAGVSLFIGRLVLDEGTEPPQVTEEFYELLSGYDVHQVVTEDTDSDGMDDFRERFFFGDLTRDGTGDADSDGLNDRDELAAMANPTERDSDGDGLEDGAEVAEHGSSPAMVDTDGDGLTDPEEVNVIGTDPAKRDTDGDEYADNVELALETDPLNANDAPTVTVAGADGAWNVAATWADEAVPTAGKTYLALGGVTNTLVSSRGPFDGDLLEVRGPHMTLSLAHEGSASAPLVIRDAMVDVGNSNRLEGVLTLSGDVDVAVHDHELDLASVLQGNGTVRFTGDDPETTAKVMLSGAGSQFSGEMRFDGVDATGTTPGSLGTGVIRIANGALTFAYPLSSPNAILQLQGTGFELILDDDVAVGDLIGLTEGGDVSFSLSDVVESNGPFDAADLLAIFGLDEGISGDGTLTLLRDAGDLDNDGLRDSWEMENFGDLSAEPEADPDHDGLTNLNEQTLVTNPKVADTDGDGLSDGEEVMVHRTNPTARDSDSDGLEDQEEIALELNPINADTDGDGLNDLTERQETLTDPKLADTDGDGFSDKIELDNDVDPLSAASQPNRFVVRTIVSDDGQVQSLADARALLDGRAPGIETVALHEVINFTDTEANTASLPGDVLFDGEVGDHFIVHAVGKFVVAESGPWGIGFNSDDGGQLRINGTEIIEFDGNRGRNHTMRTIHLEAGEHRLEMLMYNRTGGAALEVYRASQVGEWDAVVNGPLPEGFSPVLIAFERGESSAPGIPQIQTIERSVDGIRLELDAQESVGIAFSTDLVDWQEVGQSSNGVYLDREPTRVSQEKGFYRLQNSQ